MAGDTRAEGALASPVDYNFEGKRSPPVLTAEFDRQPHDWPIGTIALGAA
jgi:hypothetical protein